MRGYKNFEGSPRPGDLRHRVQIGYTENAVNENGYPEPRDVVVCTVWSSATDAGNQHYRSADVMNSEAVINFTIRWREDVKQACGCCSRTRNGRSPRWASIPFGISIWGSKPRSQRA